MHARSRFFAFLTLIFPVPVLAQGGPLAFHGTPVAPLGGATLSLSAATGNLVVGNLGPGGVDGFELLTARAQGVKVKFPWLTDKPAGSEAAARILSDATLVEPSMTWTSHGPGGGVDIFVDFSSTGAGGHLIEIWNDETFVAHTTIPIGAGV
jgi:hypothetical protein